MRKASDHKHIFRAAVAALLILGLNGSAGPQDPVVIRGRAARSRAHVRVGPVLQALVLAGQEAPGTGGGTFAAFGQVSVNASGAVVFNARVTGGTTAGGIFLLSDRGLSPVALAGQVAPGTGSGTFSGFRSPQINDSGQVAFYAFIPDGTSRTGIFLFSNGEISPVALEGQIAPDSHLGLGSLSEHSLNGSGAVAFTAYVFTQQAGNTKGVFLLSHGTISTVALPDGWRYVSLSAPALNNNGWVAFTNQVLVGPARMTATAAVSLWQTTVSTIVISGQAAPGTDGGRFSGSGRDGEFYPPSLNNANALAFPFGVVGGSAWEGVFLWSGGNLSAAALQGQLAPGTPGTFEHFFGALLNHSGALIVLAQVKMLATPSTLRGIFKLSGASPSTLVLEGQPATGGLGTFSTIGTPLTANAVAFNDNRVVFVANLRGGSANTGIFLVPLD